MTERVVDEVPERLLEPHAGRRARSSPAARRPRAAGRPPAPATRSASRSRRAARRRSSVLEPERELAPVGARDQEQVLGELREPVDLLGRSRAAPLAAPPATRRGAARARAPCAGARAACAARARRRRRRRARARARPRAGRASRSASRRAARPRRRVCGTGSRSPGVSAEIAAARRRIDSTGRSDEPGEEVAGERREQRARSGPRSAARRAGCASVSARSSRVVADDEHERAPAARRRGVARRRDGSSRPGTERRFAKIVPAQRRAQLARR